MKWMKHMTASWDDEKIAKLIDMGGPAAYGIYWRVNEIIASQMEGPNPSCSVRYSIAKWSRLLCIRGTNVERQLRNLGATGVATVERQGSDIIATNCNLLKYRDEYARKSGHTPESVRKRTEVDIEQIHKKTIARNGHVARFSSSDIESIYLQYPRKTARAAALKAIKKALENLDEEDPVAALRVRVTEFANSPAGHKGEFVPYPATWFNRKQYLDDPKEWEK